MFWDSGHVLGQRSCFWDSGHVFGTAVMFWDSGHVFWDSGHDFLETAVVLSVDYALFFFLVVFVL
jgi:hypothetical protein